MSATGSTPASVIEESLPHEGWPSSDGEELPPGIGPYKLAWRRLRRNRVALAFGGLFLAIVILCLLAPVYANDIAHTGPNRTRTSTRRSNSFGMPIGPTWHAHYFLGADNVGRDVAVRLLYGGRNSLQIGAVATLITIVFATLLALLAGYFRGPLDGLISRAFELIWAYPIYLLGIALGVVLAISGLDLGFVTLSGNSTQIPAIIIGLDLHPVCREAGPRPDAHSARARVRRRRAPAGPRAHADHVQRDPAQRRLDDHRVHPADHGQRDPARGGPVVPRRRRAARRMRRGER